MGARVVIVRDMGVDDPLGRFRRGGLSDLAMGKSHRVGVPISVYRVLNRQGLLGPRTQATPPSSRRPWVHFERANPHELWKTDVSCWYIEGWGYYYLHTILDDHSRYIITSLLYWTYRAADGIRMLDTALAAVPAADREGLQL